MQLHITIKHDQNINCIPAKSLETEIKSRCAPHAQQLRICCGTSFGCCLEETCSDGPVHTPVIRSHTWPPRSAPRSCPASLLGGKCAGMVCDLLRQALDLCVVSG